MVRNSAFGTVPGSFKGLARVGEEGRRTDLWVALLGVYPPSRFLSSGDTALTGQGNSCAILYHIRRRTSTDAASERPQLNSTVLHPTHIIPLHHTHLTSLTLYTVPIIRHYRMPQLRAEHVQTCWMPTPSTPPTTDHPLLPAHLVPIIRARAERAEMIPFRSYMYH